MIAIIGASGKVGFATAQVLRQSNISVRAIVRDVLKAQQLSSIGCQIAVADLLDATSIVKAIATADTVQVILPPSTEASDGVKHMQRVTENIATALEQTKPKLVLAISDYGAHVTYDIGMPTMCRAFEERLRKVSGNKLFLRSAEHMQNLGRAASAAASSGTLPTFSDPVDMPRPTISAPDLGVIAAELLLRPITAKEVDIVHAEGPRRYSPNDVARALSDLLSRPINVAPIPRSQWTDILEQAMSPSLASLLTKANDANNEGGIVDIEKDVGEVLYGTTDLIEALRPMIIQK